MPQLMPYHLEKGPTIRLIEQHLNGTADEMRAMLDTLRASAGSVDWVTHAIPGLWDDEQFARSPLGSGQAVHDELIRNWLGFETGGTGQAGTWAPAGGDTTGYWVAYRGDVNEIVRRTLQWALELALGIPADADEPGRDEPWPVEIFWKCPTPWFEGWVVTRPTGEPGGGRASRRRDPRGLVTVIFMSPSHLGANVAESPIAHDATTFPPGATHAVPSWQDDYEVLGEPHPLPNRPSVPAHERSWSTWIVTHGDHVTTGAVEVTTDTTAAADFADWDIPQVGIYAGQGDIVVVSPSVPAGGVPEDGAL
jgi:hypothetical protein